MPQEQQVIEEGKKLTIGRDKIKNIPIKMIPVAVVETPPLQNGRSRCSLTIRRIIMPLKHKGLEGSKKLTIDWNKIQNISDNVIPVAVQDIANKEILLIGYANQVALLQTLKTKIATFYSTRRKTIWIKGESSGNKLIVNEVRVNCEQNSLLYLVKLAKGGACHTQENGESRKSCYYRRITGDKDIVLEFVK